MSVLWLILAVIAGVVAVNTAALVSAAAWILLVIFAVLTIVCFFVELERDQDIGGLW